MAGAFEANGTNTGAAAPDADLRAIWRLLWAKKALIIGPALLAAAAALFIAGSMTPMYRSSAQILVERNDTVYTRPEGATASEIREADELAVQSQVQLLLSRDIGRQVVEDLKLAETDEFAPGSQGVVKRILSLIGLSSARLTASPDEQVLDHFFKNLSVYSVPTSRVIVIEFISSDPDLAARAANTLAERYLETQQTVKQTTTRKASGWLAAQIEELSAEVEKAEARVEKFRSGSNLFIGNNNATITNQQLGELSSELARARATQADAQAKAQLLKDVVASGRAIESLDVANSELLR